MKKETKSKNKISILVFFDKKEIPQNIKNEKKYSFPLNFIFKKEDSLYVLLDEISHLNKLQKNYYLLYVGIKLNKFCKQGLYVIDYFGSKELNERNLHLGWELANYRFENFKIVKKKKNAPCLFHNHKNQVDNEKRVFYFVRDLINTPANVLGPNEIFNTARDFLKNSYNSKKISGSLLKKKFPLISAVGQGASKKKQPLFCELKLKKTRSKKKVCIIGKGVSFDTGGLNLKTGSGMALMKKDMGGAANSIGLAKLISSHKLDIDVNLMLCLVENSVSSNSIRPSDIFKSRDGRFVEIGDTDAEGRLILADAITYACESKPDLIIDMATLTGASRVALGIEVPSFFCNDDDLSMKLIDSSQEVGDPLWQLPLWENYSTQLISNHADVKNIGNSVFGGAITAALFLEKFIKYNIPWIHVDLMAWSKPNRLSSYEGGEAMGIRALMQLIKKRFG